MEKINFERIDEAHAQLLEAQSAVRKAFFEQIIALQSKNAELRSVLRQCKMVFEFQEDSSSSIEKDMIEKIEGVLKW